uniref:LRRNT domain-containing protein n=1 Tax=Trichuris muris TaxID=70415 RepID=A0A5S6QG24_TRIMR
MTPTVGARPSRLIDSILLMVKSRTPHFADVVTASKGSRSGSTHIALRLYNVFDRANSNCDMNTPCVTSEWARCILFSIALLLSTQNSIAYCPENNRLKAMCTCESTGHNTILDCSDCTGQQTIEVLKENRAKLGLLMELRLRNCTLTELKENQFDGLFVKKLDLTDNLIETVDIKAFEGLKNVLQTLLLGGNRLKELPNKALNNMEELQHLDLSSNEIGDIDENEQLINLPKLTDLNLVDNRICSIHKDTFDMVKPTLQTLNLGKNCLAEVPAAAIRGFKHLLALHLQRNNISAIRALQFINLPMLSLLNLANNQIEIIQRQSFVNVPMIRFLYLGDNNYTSLESHTFSTLESLELLDLTNNQITKVPTDAFSGMPKLAQLYLGQNRITQIEPNAFNNSSLVILMLPMNDLSRLEPDMFNGLTYLQQCSLKSNKIASIASNTFYSVPNLVVLDLSHNQLDELPPSTFIGQPKLFLLDLSYNRLPRIPYEALNRRTVTVMLHENPLVCTEQIHMLENNIGIHVSTAEDHICGGSSFKQEQANTISDGPTTGEEVGPKENSVTEGIADGGAISKSSNKEEEKITLPAGIVVKEPIETTKQPTMEATEPEVIYPVPIPFLSKAPPLLEAYAVYTTTATPLEHIVPQTTFFTGLPLDIITALPEWTNPPGYSTAAVGLHYGNAKQDYPVHRSFSEHNSNEEQAEDTNKWSGFSESAKMTASVCIGIVIALTLIVVAVLYFVRRRNLILTRRSESNESRTTAYVNAHTYGCHNYPPFTQPEGPRRPSRQCDISTYARNPPNWLYDPVCYSSTPSAYRP